MFAEGQTEMQLRSHRVGNIYLYSPELSEADQQLTGVHMVTGSLTEAVQQSLQRQAARSGGEATAPRVALIPEGPCKRPRKIPWQPHGCAGLPVPRGWGVCIETERGRVECCSVFLMVFLLQT